MRRAIAALAAALLLVAGCGEPEPPANPPGPVDPGTTPRSEPAGPVALSPTAGCSVVGDLEGQFTASPQMRQYLECVLPAVEDWIDQVYTSMPHPAAYQFVPIGVTGKDSGCDYDADALKYCNLSNVVYFGENAVWGQYTKFGDAAPAVIAAHEVTHHIQRMLRMPLPKAANEVIRYENQADCGAGAFMAYARGEGLLNVADDIVDLAGSLQDAGESEGPGRTHGTIDERLQSFDLAYLSDAGQPMQACVSFVPEVPIIEGGTAPG